MRDQTDCNPGALWSAMGVVLAMLLGCSSTPSTKILTPMTARPPEEKMAPHDGAIFHAGLSEHPLFEDVRARNVGDTLTVTLVENTSANQKNANDASHTGSLNYNSPTLTANKTLVAGMGISSSSADKLANANDSSASNVLNGTITVTVIEVLSNGSLVVSGEKQVAINQTEEYIRLSGVVRPSYIAFGNTVLSTQVADARIEYKGGDSNIDKASVMSMLGRFFLSVLPF